MRKQPSKASEKKHAKPASFKEQNGAPEVCRVTHTTRNMEAACLCLGEKKNYVLLPQISPRTESIISFNIIPSVQT